jgi:thiamine-phosphate pyrophosphorylase
LPRRFPGRETFSAQASGVQTLGPEATSPMFPPGLYAIADDGARPGLSVQAQVDALLQGGAHVLQLRLKRTTGAASLALARWVRQRTRAAGTVFLVNDRVDWALLCGADGVHLGEEDLGVAEARHLLGQAAVVGATVRSAEEAVVAKAQGADYVGLGPIFPPRSKAVAAPLVGLVGLQRAVGESPLPVVAIGGVGLESIRAVARTGAHGAAVVSDVLLAEDMAARVRALQEEFLRGVEERGVP